MIENDLLKNTSDDIAEFLHKGEGLNKTAIGDYLGERLGWEWFFFFALTTCVTYSVFWFANHLPTNLCGWKQHQLATQHFPCCCVPFGPAHTYPFPTTAFSPTFRSSSGNVVCCSRVYIWLWLSYSYVNNISMWNSVDECCVWLLQSSLHVFISAKMRQIRVGDLRSDWSLIHWDQ